MRTKGCLDEAAIQAYLDGELAAEAHATAARHLAACDECATALDAAQGELSFFATAFAPDAEVNVPTERLRASLDDALAALRPARVEPAKGNGRSFGALLGWLASPFALAPRHAGAFAGLAALVALALVFGLVYKNRLDTATALVGSNYGNVVEHLTGTAFYGHLSRNDETKDKTTDETGNGSEQRQPDADENENATPAPKIQQNAPRQQRRTPRVLKDVLEARTTEVAEAKTNVETTVPVASNGEVRNRFVPGEENYVRAVASLQKMIEVGGDRALRPSVRADYERNLAVINRAIEDTRRAALRNPKDSDAAAYLFSSYQTKIDMMRSVADQAQVATLGR
ncbi:MAG TPA: zf-HC2 domain-containing protein [Pyrinomonadaceae bacterium]|nr:zf-HC2 domain-containing protein [Pyrinomonadaceae bacterium]